MEGGGEVREGEEVDRRWIEEFVTLGGMQFSSMSSLRLQDSM